MIKEEHTAKGNAGNSSETFGFLASPSARSYNTVYAAHFVRPNSAKGGTSQSPNTLSEIAIYYYR